MSLMINDLRNFDNFVGNVADNRKVEISNDGRITLATKSASAISRMFALTENARTAIENNNRVREAFVDALKRQFNVQDFSSLPATVKAALVGSHAKTAEGDFGFDAQGHVTSGKPLTARRISAVLNAVRLLGMVKGETAKKEVLPLLNGECLKDKVKFSLEMNKQQVKSGSSDDFYYTLSNSDTGIKAISRNNTNIPVQFEMDFKRTSFFILPGVGQVKYHANDLSKAADDITKSVTQGRVKHFSDLKGEDLKKVQLVMAMMTQTSGSAIGTKISSVVFDKDEYGATKALIQSREEADISYELQLDNDGGITVKTRLHTKISHLDADVYDKEAELESDGMPDYWTKTIKLNSDKSHYNASMTVKYSKDKLNDIISKDWDGMSNAELEKVIIADSREFDLENILFEA